MTISNLGAGFSNPKRADFGPLAEMVGAMREEIAREVLSDVLSQRQSLLTEVADIVAQAVAKVNPPNVLVSAPPIPQNTVNLPEMRPVINIEASEDEQGEIDAMDRNTAAVQALTQEVSMLRQLLARPVVKEVTRDQNDNITRVTETR